MPSKTDKQKRFFGAVMGAKTGQSSVSDNAKKVAKEMPKKEIKKFLKKEGEEDAESIAQTTVELPDGVWSVHFVNGKVVEVAPTFQTSDMVNPINVNLLLKRGTDLVNAVLNSKQTNEQDEQSISKQIKKTGKASFKGPEVKERKHFAPPTQTHKAKKGKGSYDRKNQFMGESVDMNTQTNVFVSKIFPAMQDANQKGMDLNEFVDYLNKTMNIRYENLDSYKQKAILKAWKDINGRIDYRHNPYLKESTEIIKFIDSILTKNYAAADKYIKQAVELKLQDKIEQELSTPLF